MCSWRRVAVARVFELVVRCRIMMLFVYSRVGKNRDTRRGTPAGAGAGRTADHLTILFSQRVLAVRSANCIYRPVSCWALCYSCWFTLRINGNAGCAERLFTQTKEVILGRAVCGKCLTAKGRSIFIEFD